jgi:hypothetical protein
VEKYLFLALDLTNRDDKSAWGNAKRPSGQVAWGEANLAITLQKVKRDATNGRMDSLRWRELIKEFQKKSMHIAHLGMKLGLGGC